MAFPLEYADSIERIPSDEASDIDRIIEILKQRLRERFERTGHKQRDVHVKAHGSAEGTFRVEANLPDELAQGLFAESKEYSASVRFSNSAPWVQADAVPDGRGLAIQVAKVSGERIHTSDSAAGSQDFVLVNHSVFIAKDVKDYLRIEQARLEAGDQRHRLPFSLVRYFRKPLNLQWRELAAVANVLRQPPSHPATYTYFSMSPFRFDKRVAKFRAVPVEKQLLPRTRTAASVVSHSDAMWKMLSDTLAKQEIRFAFQVQLRTSEQSMPIEDATVEWPEAESPYRTVAYLSLPPQDIQTAERRSTGERRSFNVWNALAAHRPLGGINRLRRVVYAVSAAHRLDQG